MGNETLLFSTASSAKPPADWRDPVRRGGLILGAKYGIPLFWFLLYDLDCLVAAEGPAESGGTIPYLAMSRETGPALALARARWPMVRPILGDGEDELFARWVGFVEGRAAAYLHCETWEWSWLFPTPRAFRSHLWTCLSAFDHVPRRRVGRVAMNRWWRALLGQCGAVDGQGQIRPLGDFSYCGVAHGSSGMPWSLEPRGTPEGVAKEKRSRNK